MCFFHILRLGAGVYSLLSNFGTSWAIFKIQSAKLVRISTGLTKYPPRIHTCRYTDTTVTLSKLSWAEFSGSTFPRKVKLEKYRETKLASPSSPPSWDVAILVEKLAGELSIFFSAVCSCTGVYIVQKYEFYSPASIKGMFIFPYVQKMLSAFRAQYPPVHNYC